VASERDSDALSAAFSHWCAHWYKLAYGEAVRVTPYTDRTDQHMRGDVRVQDASGAGWNYDEKAFGVVWNGLLVELLQDSTPNAHGKPGSLGWFYELTECDYLLCGYYRHSGAAEPAEVYRVSLRRLRAFFAKLVHTSGPTRSHAMLTDKGFGITLGAVLPWPLLLANGCVELVYAEPISTEDDACGSPRR